MDPTRAAIRTAKAKERSDRFAKNISKKTGVDASVLRVKSKDPVVRGVLREEALAEFLKDLDGALETGPAQGAEVGLGPEEKRRVANFAANLAKTGEGNEPPAVSITPDFLTTKQRESLIGAGYRSDGAVLAASDEDLVALEGMGQTTVDKYREAFGV